MCNENPTPGYRLPIPAAKAEESLALDRIDPADDLCRLSRDPAPVLLLRSVETLGLINPLLLARRKDGSAMVVCGFRRLEVCRELGYGSVPVRILDPAPDDARLLTISLLDNLSHRCLTDPEKAVAVEKFSRYLDRKRVIAEILPLLGLHPHERDLERYLTLAGLPAEALRAVAAGELTVDAAVLLTLFDPRDRALVAGFVGELRLSAAKQREVMELIHEIHRREALPPTGIMGEIREEAGGRSELSRPQKTAFIRGLLKRRRFPRLAAMEDDYARWLASLRLKNTVGIKHAPFFEGPTRRVEFSFTDRRELGEILETLGDLFRQGKLDPLFEERHGL